MRFLQIEKFLRALCGYILFPVLMIFALLRAGIQNYNFTGLLNLAPAAVYIKSAAFLMLVWYIRTFILLKNNESRAFRLCLILFSICAAGAVLTPYINGTAYAAIHLFFSYSALLFFQILLLPLLISESVFRLLYIGGTFFCAMLCLSAGEISGLSELIYACMISELLTYQCTKKDL